jgi:hypothetical protein
MCFHRLNLHVEVDKEGVCYKPNGAKLASLWLAAESGPANTAVENKPLMAATSSNVLFFTIQRYASKYGQDPHGHVYAESTGCSVRYRTHSYYM